jgi:predicted transcriptional regulator
VASTTIRSTYALDEDTVQRLGHLAKRWNVSKSEALRKAIRMADAELPADDRLAALDALQASMRLSGKAAEEWVRLVRRERRASSRPAAGQP